MAQVVNEELEPGHVVEEAQQGYRLHERLLRPALVTVSIANPDKPRVEEDVPEEFGFGEEEPGAAHEESSTAVPSPVEPGEIEAEAATTTSTEQSEVTEPTTAPEEGDTDPPQLEAEDEGTDSSSKAEPEATAEGEPALTEP
jgi:hypothetical protein